MALAKRNVELQVAWQLVKIHPPKLGGERQQGAIEGWCIRCWEASPAPESKEWILFTTVPITDVTSAEVQVDWYAHRWIIEEYHKCIKTGCAIQARQLTTAQRLQRLLGFLAIVAVKLLQLRMLSRLHTEQLARSVVPPVMLRVLVALVG